MVTVGPLVTAAGMAAGGSVAASKDRNQHSEGKVKLAGVEANFKGSPYLIVALFGFLLAAAFYLDLI
jgi:hypothetical protein